MSTVSSRTPEGEPVRCPVCGHVLVADPSRPLMDHHLSELRLFVDSSKPQGSSWVDAIAIVRATATGDRKSEDPSAFDGIALA